MTSQLPLVPMPPRIDLFTVEKLGGVGGDLAKAERALARACEKYAGEGYVIHRVDVLQHAEFGMYKARLVISDPRYYGAASMWAAASLGVSYD